jgi:hypothetical protein
MAGPGRSQAPAESLIAHEGPRREGSAATDLAPPFVEAVDVESVGPALHEALDGTDRLRAGRADGVRRWLRDQTGEWL